MSAPRRSLQGVDPFTGALVTAGFFGTLVLGVWAVSKMTADARIKFHYDTYRLGPTSWGFTITDGDDAFVHAEGEQSSDDAAKAAAKAYIFTKLGGGPA